MSVRLLLTDKAWEQIAAILALVKHPAGSPPVLSDRMFIEAVLYVARTGLPWRDMPAEFGRWEPSITASAAGKVGVCGANGGTTDNAERSRWLKTSSLTRRLCAPISMRPGRYKKRRPSGPGFGTLSGWIFHQNPRWLDRRNDRRVVRSHRGPTP
jgi:transposase